MQVIEAGVVHKRLGGDSAKVVVRLELECVRVNYQFRVKRQRGLDIFEQHILLLLQANAEAMRVSEIGSLLGCSRAGFVLEVIMGLQAANAVVTTIVGEETIVDRGAQFDRMLRSLEIEDRLQVLSRTALYEPAVGLFDHAIAGRRDEDERGESINHSPELLARILEGICDWHEGVGKDDVSGDFAGLEGAPALRRVSVPIDVLLFVDSQKREWHIDVIDPVVEEWRAELVPAVEKTYIKQMKELLSRSVSEGEVGSAPALPARSRGRVKNSEGTSRSDSGRADRRGAGKSSSIGSSGHRPLELEEGPFETAEARRLIIEEVGRAQHEVVFRFPFVSRDGVMDFLPVCKEAVELRGVQCVFLWGMAKSLEEEHENQRKRESANAAVRALESIGSREMAADFFVKWVGNDHSKWIMVDRQIEWFGSYNVLSYRPWPNESDTEIRRDEMRRIKLAPKQAADRIDQVRKVIRMWGESSSESFRLEDLCRWLRVNATADAISHVRKEVRPLSPTDQATLFMAACRGAEMTCAIAPETARPLRDAVSMLAEVCDRRRDPEVFGFGPRPSWRRSAIGFDTRLKEIDPALSLGTSVLGAE